MGNFCMNCGAKLEKDDNFCMNCGTKIKKESNTCTNCGAKLEKDDNFCMNCGTKVKKEIDSGKIKNEEVEIRVSQIIHEYKIKKEDQKKSEATKEQRKTRPAKEKEIINKKINANEMTSGGYCSFNCRHCYEEFFDGGGGIVGDFDSAGYSEFYCQLGHTVSFGRFCKYYE